MNQQNSRLTKLQRFVNLPQQGHKIPKQIWQIWLDKNNDEGGPPSKYMTDKFILGVKKTNPNFKHNIVTMKMMKILFNQYPEIQRFKHFFFHEIREWIVKCDFARLIILYLFGGIYLDCDVIALKPFDELIKDRSTVLIYDQIHFPIFVWLVNKNVREDAIFNGIMAASPRQPWIYELLVYIHHRYEKTNGSFIDVFSLSGPYALGKFFRKQDLMDENEFPEIFVNSCLLMPETSGGPIPSCRGIESYCKVDFLSGSKWQLELSQIFGNTALAVKTWHLFLLVFLLLIASLLFIFLRVNKKALQSCEVKKNECEIHLPKHIQSSISHIRL